MRSFSSYSFEDVDLTIKNHISHFHFPNKTLENLSEIKRKFDLFTEFSIILFFTKQSE